MLEKSLFIRLKEGRGKQGGKNETKQMVRRKAMKERRKGSEEERKGVT